jgi:hypothetical protein
MRRTSAEVVPSRDVSAAFGKRADSMRRFSASEMAPDGVVVGGATAEVVTGAGAATETAAGLTGDVADCGAGAGAAGCFVAEGLGGVASTVAAGAVGVGGRTSGAGFAGRVETGEEEVGPFAIDD